MTLRIEHVPWCYVHQINYVVSCHICDGTKAAKTPREFSRAELDVYTKALKECDIDGEATYESRLGSIHFSINGSGWSDGITFAQLEAISKRFKTKDINLGSELGYYGSRYDEIVVLNAPAPEDM